MISCLFSNTMFILVIFLLIYAFIYICAFLPTFSSAAQKSRKKITGGQCIRLSFFTISYNRFSIRNVPFRASLRGAFDLRVTRKADNLFCALRFYELRAALRALVRKMKRGCLKGSHFPSFVLLLSVQVTLQ